ncbi:hypothetical protein PQ469_25955 [Mucilaginibacter sp. KACC 22773]|uniref:ImmA/IrrE family metallo-endopeptidase n=1 Tax=Mucilaginibacter sp. KACC 22773 TaxID=3025671 RepID=UPI002365BB1D|nr:hypothetical protein [Mucilaginibacter sp. KACC 22773]WDF77333.1 hypothetical protein PQ469_25955 [Mucilaginibacter sp. KACC 22773]
MNRFNNPEPKLALENHLNYLLNEVKQLNFPIKLSAVAKKIGINPNPIYINQPYDASLILHDDKVRIALKIGVDNKRSLTSWERFSYAHELIHCLSYDLSSIPNKRIAPLPNKLEEEHLCNYGAIKLLLPTKVLQRYFQNIVSTGTSYMETIKEIASVSECSVPMVTMELFNVNLIKPTPNTIYILSQRGSGYQRKDIVKPRCLVSIYLDENGNKQPFLASQQGLQHVRLNDDDKKWSLLNFFERHELNQITIQNEIIYNDKTGMKATISGTHTKFTDNSLIWSELNVEKYSN